MITQRQRINTYFAGNVAPGSVSSIVLSGGADKPYIYSLGNQSTVPFIRLQGSGNTQKEFTWGETIEVFPGENVQVQNASYMAGDIQIQSGRDVANKPARISMPIEVTTGPGANFGSTLFTPKYPCDCRQARRAYLGLSMFVKGPNFGTPVMQIIGLNQQHTWPGDVDPFILVLPPTGKKYINNFTFMNNTQYTQIPLGYGAEQAPSTNPMTLVDFATWSIDVSSIFVGPDLVPQAIIAAPFFYVLEYE